MDLTILIYGLTADFPKHEIYGMSSQMRRAGVSIASNLAEGSARGSKKDFRQFVIIARGSNYELQTQLMLARRLQYSTAAKITEAEDVCSEVARMLNGLCAFLAPKVLPPSLTTKN
jgi:four helix bundle protein